MFSPDGTDVLMTKFVSNNSAIGQSKNSAVSLTVPSFSSLQKTQNTVMTITSMAMERERAITSSSDFSVDSYHSSDRRTDFSTGSFPSKNPGWGPTYQGFGAGIHQYIND